MRGDSTGYGAHGTRVSRCKHADIPCQIGWYGRVLCNMFTISCIDSTSPISYTTIPVYKPDLATLCSAGPPLFRLSYTQCLNLTR
mgnify:CR=1 FL=1